MAINGGDVFRTFCTLARNVHGLSESEVKEILKKKWKGFDPRKFQEHMAFIDLEMIERKKLQQLEAQQEAINQRYTPAEIEQVYGPSLCPFCNASTIPDLTWFGKYTRRPGWRCPKNAAHFLWWKANRVCEQRGETIPFPEVCGSVQEDHNGTA